MVSKALNRRQFVTGAGVGFASTAASTLPMPAIAQGVASSGW